MVSSLLRTALVLTAIFVTACAATTETTSTQAPTNHSESWHSESWREIIPADCSHFFDGCNQCQRSPGAAHAACTRKACAQYQQPKCLDKQSSIRNNSKNFSFYRNSSTTIATGAPYTIDPQ